MQTLRIVQGKNHDAEPSEAEGVIRACQAVPCYIAVASVSTGFPTTRPMTSTSAPCSVTSALLHLITLVSAGFPYGPPQPVPLLTSTIHGPFDRLHASPCLNVKGPERLTFKGLPSLPPFLQN